MIKEKEGTRLLLITAPTDKVREIIKESEKIRSSKNEMLVSLR